MERIGLTGSIGMGKSTTAAMLRHLRVPVFDADAVVHELTGPGGAAVPAIAAIFPSAVRDGAVDRQVLGGIVFADRAALRRLEGVLHPLVGRARGRFLRRHRRARRRWRVWKQCRRLAPGGLRGTPSPSPRSAY